MTYQYQELAVGPSGDHRTIVKDGVAIIEGFLMLEQVQKLNKVVDVESRPRLTSFVPDHVHVARVVSTTCRCDYWLGYGAVIENDPRSSKRAEMTPRPAC
ncbi:hypothetical protein E4U12_000850 [Claviceps purpurea]|nr:hypothetical protein E4U12_000850 [Claviceps purpurea]